jgi:hypothetical protein
VKGFLALSLAAAVASAGAGLASAAAVDPYRASLDYVHCMRAHGFGLPDPQPNGDLELTPAQEERIRRTAPAGRRAHDAADRACFHHLRPVVNTAPLSKGAKRRVVAVLRGLGACMRRYGYDLGRPVVRDLPRGQVFAGFDAPSARARAAQGTERFRAAQRVCERGLARRVDAAIGDERSARGYAP